MAYSLALPGIDNHRQNQESMSFNDINKLLSANLVVRALYLPERLLQY